MALSLLGTFAKCKVGIPHNCYRFRRLLKHLDGNFMVHVLREIDLMLVNSKGVMSEAIGSSLGHSVHKAVEFKISGGKVAAILQPWT